MQLALSEADKKTIVSMLEKGENNWRISLRFPGVRKEQITAIRDEINRGTEQTKRRLKRDPLMSLYRSEDLSMYELYAADHIRYAYQLITSGLSVRMMNFDGYIDTFRGGEKEDETALQCRIQDQYNDWFDECTKKRIKTGPIMHILTEPVTLRDTDRYYCYRNGTTKGILIKGLRLYVEMFKPRKGIDFK